jgi:hypothetical protein
MDVWFLHRGRTAIEIEGKVVPSAQVWTLTGDLSAVDTPDQPARIHPVQSTIPAASQFTKTFAPYSYTIYRLQATTVQL